MIANGSRSIFRTPADTYSAVWADNDHVWVLGNDQSDPDFGKGGWVRRCDFHGKCTAAVSPTSDFTVGGGIY